MKTETRISGMCILIVGACAVDPGGDVRVPPEVAQVSSVEVDLDGVRVDLGTLMERTRNAFVDRGGRLVGGRATYGVEAAGARISIRPFHYDAFASPADDPQIAGESIGIETVSVCRDRCPDGRTSFQPAAMGHLERRAGPSVEQLHNRAEGVEQSWRFDTAPPGVGDLTVRVAVTGHQYVDATAGGLHFRDSQSGLGFRYGHATWIDAEGTPSSLPVAFDEAAHQVVIRVPAALLESSTYPAVLDPTIGPEIAVDVPATGPAPDVQDGPAIAHSAQALNEFLVVWNDRRRDIGYTSDVFAARVDRFGTVIDPVGFMVNDPEIEGQQDSPAAVWGSGASAYAVVFRSQPPGQNPSVRVRRVFLTGAVDDFGLANPVLDSIGSSPDIAYGIIDNQQRFAVVWRREQGTPTIRARTFDNGFIESNPETHLIAMSSTVGSPAVAQGGYNQSFYVVWQQQVAGSGGYNINGRTFKDSTMGVALTVVADVGDQTEPDAAAFNTAPGYPSPGWLVAWTDAGAATRGIRARRVDPTGFTIGSTRAARVHRRVRSRRLGAEPCGRGAGQPRLRDRGRHRGARDEPGAGVRVVGELPGDLPQVRRRA